MGTRNHPDVLSYPYFVTTNTRDRRPLFDNPAAAVRLTSTMRDVASELGCLVLAYVVMPDHLHLIVVPGPLGLSHFMKILKGRYARLWNLQTNTSGSIWQERYYEVVMRSEEQLRRVVDYIDENPVKAGLVRDASLWPHSSAVASADTELMRYLTSGSRTEVRPSVEAK